MTDTPDAAISPEAAQAATPATPAKVLADLREWWTANIIGEVDQAEVIEAAIGRVVRQTRRLLRRRQA